MQTSVSKQSVWSAVALHQVCRKLQWNEHANEISSEWISACVLAWIQQGSNMCTENLAGLKFASIITVNQCTHLGTMLNRSLLWCPGTGHQEVMGSPSLELFERCLDLVMSYSLVFWGYSSGTGLDWMILKFSSNLDISIILWNAFGYSLYSWLLDLDQQKSRYIFVG